jgi:hypothetical protein
MACAAEFVNYTRNTACFQNHDAVIILQGLSQKAFKDTCLATNACAVLKQGRGCTKNQLA